MPDYSEPIDDEREAPDWTPSTEQVRAHYVFDQSNRWKPERGAAFDRWLAGVPRQGPITDERVEYICEVMHDAYELAAAREGWSTQEASRKPWADVPESNRRTMRYAVRAALEAVKEQSHE